MGTNNIKEINENVENKKAIVLKNELLAKQQIEDSLQVWEMQQHSAKDKYNNYSEKQKSKFEYLTEMNAALQNSSNQGSSKQQRLLVIKSEDLKLDPVIVNLVNKIILELEKQSGHTVSGKNKTKIVDRVTRELKSSTKQKKNDQSSSIIVDAIKQHATEILPQERSQINDESSNNQDPSSIDRTFQIQCGTLENLLKQLFFPQYRNSTTEQNAEEISSLLLSRVGFFSRFNNFNIQPQYSGRPRREGETEEEYYSKIYQTS